MSTLTIVASIVAAPDKIALVRSELEKLVPITRAEEGCLQYDLHQDDNNPAHFLFYENWTSRDLWQKHMDAPHLQAYGVATANCVEQFNLFEMHRVN